MASGLRRMYTVTDPEMLALLQDGLLAHRDRVYRDFLELPLDF